MRTVIGAILVVLLASSVAAQTADTIPDWPSLAALQQQLDVWQHQHDAGLPNAWLPVHVDSATYIAGRLRVSGWAFQCGNLTDAGLRATILIDGAPVRSLSFDGQSATPNSSRTTYAAVFRTTRNDVIFYLEPWCRMVGVRGMPVQPGFTADLPLALDPSESHAIQVRVYDAQGRVGVSNTLDVLVPFGPTVE